MSLSIVFCPSQRDNGDVCAIASLHVVTSYCMNYRNIEEESCKTKKEKILSLTKIVRLLVILYIIRRLVTQEAEN